MDHTRLYRGYATDGPNHLQRIDRCGQSFKLRVIYHGSPLLLLTLSKGIEVKPWLKLTMGAALLFDKLEIFSMSAAMAKHAGRSQAVIAQNVANADTPGYHARELPPFKSLFKTASGANVQRATRAGHLHGQHVDGFDVAPAKARTSTLPNGNSVSLETEMLRSAGAKRDHDRAMAIYKSSLGILRSTIRS